MSFFYLKYSDKIYQIFSIYMQNFVLFNNIFFMIRFRGKQDLQMLRSYFKVIGCCRIEKQFNFWLNFESVVVLHSKPKLQCKPNQFSSKVKCQTKLRMVHYNLLSAKVEIFLLTLSCSTSGTGSRHHVTMPISQQCGHC